MNKLNLRQKLFCKYYVETSGNGTEAVIKAGYKLNKSGVVNKNLARSIASENLTKPNIKVLINQLIDTNGFNSSNVKMQHLKLVKQSENLPVKAKAIDMFYKLSGEYAPAKVEETNKSLEEALDRFAALLPD